MLQETRRKGQTAVNAMRRKFPDGQGVYKESSGESGGLVSFVQGDLFIRCHEASVDWLFTEVSSSDACLMIINIYRRSRIRLASYLARLKVFVAGVRRDYPGKGILIGGDWNITPLNKVVQDFAESCSLRVERLRGPTWKRGSRKTAELDFYMVSRELRVKWPASWIPLNDSSDHRLLQIEVGVRFDGKPRVTREIYSKAIAQRVFMEALTNTDLVPLDSEKWLQTLNDIGNASRRDIIKRFDPRYLRQKIPQTCFVQSSLDYLTSWYEHMDQRWTTCSQALRKDAARAWEILRPALGPYKTRRDGAIFSHFLDDQGQIVSHQDTVNANVITKLSLIHGAAPLQKCNACLPPPEDEEVSILLERLGKDKAISIDLVPDTVLKSAKEDLELRRLVHGLWSIPLDRIPDNIFRARIVPLNKAHPGIPDAHQFRPIVVLSPIYKLLEARFLPKLERYAKEVLGAQQTGFVRGRRIQENHAMLYDQKLRGDPDRCVLFLDFSNAFNSVQRDRLYAHLGRLDVLRGDEVSYLKGLHDQLTLVCGKHSFHPRNGLVQGSMISPLLFDLYLEIFTNILVQNGYLERDMSIYADDFALFCPYEQLTTAVALIQQVSTSLGLRVNVAKSGYMYIKKNGYDIPDDLEDDIGGIPRVSKYTYLGIQMDERLSMNLHLAALQEKIPRISGLLARVAYRFAVDDRRVLWSALIRPYIEFIAPVLPFVPRTTRDKFSSLMRRSLREALRFPRSFRNETLALLLDDFEHLYDARYRFVYKLANEYWPGNHLPEPTNEEWNLPLVRTLKWLPDKITTAFRALVQKCCKDHPTERLTVLHLRQAHQYSGPDLEDIIRNSLPPERNKPNGALLRALEDSKVKYSDHLANLTHLIFLLGQIMDKSP